ncbi:hypothetical protein DdX_08468 [Ditylenchus destructor]|uniref:Uncharacterized protein n=1 Tax=Ditylenchus destructor TaxID=166010 RepID=A0AAD4N7E9_9BILA|nr:hypothetical protein DdX_08468 [Ditylenchus destructor]
MFLLCNIVLVRSDDDDDESEGDESVIVVADQDAEESHSKALEQEDNADSRRADPDVGDESLQADTAKADTINSGRNAEKAGDDINLKHDES